MKVTVVSPERIVFSGEVDSVAVPGAKGRFEILNNHAQGGVQRKGNLGT